MITLLPRAFPRTISAFFVLCCVLAVTGFAAGSGSDTAREASRVIDEYRTADPSAKVQVWQREITHPSGNPKFKEFQAQRLKEWESTEFAPYRLGDPALVSQLREVLMPVLRLYGRQDCFQVIVIRHDVPVMMNDSAVLLMVSTGLVERAGGEDELLGFAAHELGHDLFWQRTAQANARLQLYRAGRGTKLLEQETVQELARIELECDAFSAITLASMGRSPVSYGRYLETIGHDFSAYLDPGLPSIALRTKVIEGVVPANACRVAPRSSEAFLKLKAMLKTNKL